MQGRELVFLSCFLMGSNEFCVLLIGVCMVWWVGKKKFLLVIYDHCYSEFLLLLQWSPSGNQNFNNKMDQSVLQFSVLFSILCNSSCLTKI